MISTKFHRRIRLIGKFFISVGLLGIATYPIIISPMFQPEPYKELQKIGRKNIDQKDIQPGNMKIWSDPFNRKKKTMESKEV